MILSETRLDTPLGALRLVATEEALTAVYWIDHDPPPHPRGAAGRDHAILEQAVHELQQYFDRRSRRFSVPLAPEGTPFQQAVWAALRDIEHGGTRSYSEVARAIGRPRAARAVGMACNRNPLTVIVPCHRVVGASGELVGYAAGTDLKRRLLRLEREAAVRPPAEHTAATLHAEGHASATTLHTP